MANCFDGLIGLLLPAFSQKPSGGFRKENPNGDENKAKESVHQLHLGHVAFKENKYCKQHVANLRIKIRMNKFWDAEIQDINTSISIVDKLPKGGMMLVMKVTHM